MPTFNKFKNRKCIDDSLNFIVKEVISNQISIIGEWGKWDAGKSRTFVAR